MPTSMAWFRTGWQSQEDVCGTIGIFDPSITPENAYARRFYIHDCFQLLVTVSWIICCFFPRMLVCFIFGLEFFRRPGTRRPDLSWLNIRDRVRFCQKSAPEFLIPVLSREPIFMIPEAVTLTLSYLLPRLLCWLLRNGMNWPITSS